MRHLFLIGIILGCFAAPAHAKRTGTLPGGLLYPVFANAAFTNAAALNNTLGTEFQALYSPPLNQLDPHAFSLGIATSSRLFGVNVGYTGSTQSSVAFHNLYAGGSAKLFKRVTMGLAVRKFDVEGGGEMFYDVSAIYALSRKISFGTVLYGAGSSKPMLATGIGWRTAERFSLEVDALTPLGTDDVIRSKESALNAAMAAAFGRFGIALGIRKTNLSYPTHQLSEMSSNIGLAYKFHKSWTIVSQYNSTPQTISIGIAWNDSPTPQQLIRYFQNRNNDRLIR